jgi:hypothetical protein
MRLQYRTSRQSRAGLANITPGRRSRARVEPAPSGALYRVRRPSDSMGQLVRAESAAAAVVAYRAQYALAADVALVVSDR